MTALVSWENSSFPFLVTARASPSLEGLDLHSQHLPSLSFIITLSHSVILSPRETETQKARGTTHYRASSENTTKYWLRRGEKCSEEIPQSTNILPARMTSTSYQLFCRGGNKTSTKAMGRACRPPLHCFCSLPPPQYFSHRCSDRRLRSYFVCRLLSYGPRALLGVRYATPWDPRSSHRRLVGMQALPKLAYNSGVLAWLLDVLTT